MIGTTLKNLLDEREIKVNEFARQIKVPAQTLYSIIRRDNMKIDFELLLRICDALHVPLETFCGTGSTGQPTPEEWETLWKLRRLDDHGRFVTLQLLDAECARLQAAQRQPERNKIIPLYMTPAAAGYASPALEMCIRDRLRHRRAECGQRHLYGQNAGDGRPPAALAAHEALCLRAGRRSAGRTDGQQ